MNIFSRIFNKKKNKVHFYITRDKDGDLILWIGKPNRTLSEIWRGYDAITWIAIGDQIPLYGINPKDFDNLKWEDEPVEVFLNMEE